jgi:integrase
MATAKITKRTVEALRPSDRDAFLWDSECKGFGVKITPAGKLVYLLQYRLGGRGSPTRRYTIGAHDSPWTPAAAGEEARRLMTLVSQGIDPADMKRRKVREANELSFNAVADRFERLEVPVRWAKSGEFVKATLRLHLRPKLGKRPLPSITGTEITALLDDMNCGTALRRNIYAVAHRLFKWAQGRGDIDRSPLEGFDAPALATSRDRVLDDRELKLVVSASTSLGPIFGALVRLLLLTGQRRDEVAALDWRELHRDRSEWLLPAIRAKNGRPHLIPLSSQAIDELDALAGGEDWPSQGYVLTTDAGKSRVSGFSKAKKKLDEAIAKLIADGDAPALEPWRYHDLRRSVATGMQRLRISSDWIEAVQNRRKAGVAAIYQRYDYGQEKREALDRWDAHIRSVIIDSNVVQLRLAKG